jgi:hypothetical protein
MKKLRVYYKCSILSNIQYFDVASPAEGKTLIDALEDTVGKIIQENDVKEIGAYSIGLQEEDDTMEDGWCDWMSHDGDDIFNYTPEELREMEYFRSKPF